MDGREQKQCGGSGMTCAVWRPHTKYNQYTATVQGIPNVAGTHSLGCDRGEERFHRRTTSSSIIIILPSRSVGHAPSSMFCTHKVGN